MNREKLECALRDIRSLVKLPGEADIPDEDLVRRYADSREEAAFAALVRRYGPAVLRVCYRVLQSSHDAEDAFQATFMVLAREVALLHHPKAIGAWIHEVAYHAALRVRQRMVRQRRHEEKHVPQQNNDAPEAGILREDIQAALYEELHRLPEKYRNPLVLCNLLGRTQEQAARELGLQRTTLNKRLKRAYGLLRLRLLGRGITLSILLLVSLLHAEGKAAPLSLDLLLRTVRGTIGTVPNSMGAIAAATRGAFLFSIGSLKITPMLFAGFLLLLGVGGWAVHGWRTPSPDRADPTPMRSLQTAAPPQQANPPPIGASMELAGQIVDVDGVAVPGARVAVCGLRSFRRGKRNVRDEVLAWGQSDAAGHFRVTVGRPPSVWSMRSAFVHLWAAAPGHAPATVRLPWQPQIAPVEVRLPKPDVIRGRMIGAEGRPAVHVRVLVSQVGVVRLEPIQQSRRDSRQREPAFWPEPVTTDAEGCFTLRGLNLKHGVGLYVCDDRYALRRVVLEPSRWTDQVGTLQLASARLLEGRVTTSDAGMALPKARLCVLALDAAGRAVGCALDARADARGVFHIRLPFANSYRVEAFAPEGMPYLGITRAVPWTADATRQELALTLPRGTLIRGRATDADNGKPVPDIHVQFRPLDGTAVPPEVLTGLSSLTTGGVDGSFRLVVPKAPGLLIVHEPNGDYVTEEWTGRLSEFSDRLYAQRVVPLDAARGAEVREIRIALRRGVCITGRVVGPDGESVAEGAWLCRGRTCPQKPTEGQPQSFWDGRFTLRGCVPGRVYPLLFLDALHHLGAQVELVAGTDNAKPIEVRLQPCGAAEVRFIDPAGLPIAGYRPFLYVMAPPDRSDDDEDNAETDLAEMHELDEFDPDHYREGPRTDAEGRVTLPALIPGVRYRMSRYLDSSGAWREFETTAGQTLSLSDVVLRHRH